MRSIMGAVASLAALSVAATPATALNRTCENSKLVIAPCYWVYGNLALAQGTPGVRIGILRTRRVIGAFDYARNAEGPTTIPEPVRALLYRGNPGWAYVSGNYRVCPFTKERKGWMRFVCISDTRHLRRRTV